MTQDSHPLNLPFKRSQRALYVLVAVAAVVFGLFWTVGFDRPFADNPAFRAPLFTTAVIWLGILMLIAALGVTLWAVVRNRKHSGRGTSVLSRRIAVGTAVSTLLVMVIGFAFASPAPVEVNGQPFANGLWLRVANMFVLTSLWLIAATVGAVVFSTLRHRRKEEN